MAAMLAVLLPRLSPPALAAGAPVVYARTSVTLQGVSMRTRGYLQDDCLLKVDYPCLTYTSGTFKPEGTAQARAIQQLALLNDRNSVPFSDASASKVQWEVGPGDDTWPPDGPPDADDPDCPNTGRWRIDIVTEDAGSELSAYEVKAWSAGRQAPRTQLNCYLSRAAAAGITLSSGSQLHSWVRTYPDKTAHTWCVWGDQEDPLDPASGDGLVFFAPIEDPSIPAFVRTNLTGGCEGSIDPLPARCARVLTEEGCVDVATALGLALLILLVAEEAGRARPDGVPVGAPGTVRFEPFAQLTGTSLHPQWTVVVQPLPTQPLTLVFDGGAYVGDWLTETVPAGSTPFTEVVFDDLPAGYGIAVQRAAIVETGQEATAVTAEDSDFLPPELFGLPNVVQCVSNQHTISISDTHGLALAGGEPWSWGANTDGELGRSSGTTGQPGPVPGLHSILSVAAGDRFSLALRSDGTVWAWGANSYGELGNGTATKNDVWFATRSYPAPTLVGVLGATSVVAAAGTSGGFAGVPAGALRSDGTAWAWGDLSRGMSGDGSTTTGVLRSQPTELPIANPVVSLAINRDHGLAIDSSAQAWGWGSAEGVNGSTSNSSVVTGPTVVTGGAVSVAASYLSSVIAKSDGQVWTTGYNFVDQLAQNTSVLNAPPAPITGQPRPAVAVSATDGSTPMALLNDGTLAVWGDNGNGSAGIGTLDPDEVFVPTVVPGVSGVTDVVSGFGSALALLGDGTVLSWGTNNNGQLGNGQTGVNQNPTPAPMILGGVDQPGGVDGPGACGGGTLAAANGSRAASAAAARTGTTPRFATPEARTLKSVRRGAAAAVRPAPVPGGHPASARNA